VDDRVWPVAMGVAAFAGLLGAFAVTDSDAVREDPVAGFLAAYERSRTATFVVEQTFTRTAPDGRSISYGRRLVQRPPDDRLLVGGGNAEGRIDGRVVRCSTAPDGSSSCQQGPPAGPYDDEVAAELAELRRYVSELYYLAPGDPGCWVLDLVEAYPSPPYGEEATFCFDPATGAPTRLEVVRPEATDVTEAVEIRATVTGADLDPGDLGDLPGN
jgi:hypothetical protein